MDTVVFFVLSLTCSLGHAEFLGEDVKIKFVFDTVEDPVEDTVVDFPFSTNANLRNISLVSDYSGDAGEENKKSTFKPDRRNLQPGRALTIGLSSSNGLSGESTTRSDLSKLAVSKPDESGKRCLDKVIMEEITEYEEVVTCNHSYDKRCHTSYITTYDSQQVQECEENFVKTCYIEYEQRAVQETVKVCRNQLVRNCNSSGPEVCRTIYQSECWTRQEEHQVEDDVPSCQSQTETSCSAAKSGYLTRQECKEWPRQVCKVYKRPVTKYTPVTGCNKEPVQLCSPKGCGYQEGPEECHDKTKTLIQDVPKETCDLEPRMVCQFVTKLVPKLEPSEECVDVPKEVCTRERGNPRKVQRPAVKRWCYVASGESGLE